MDFVHTMLRVQNLDKSLKFFRDDLGLQEIRRIEFPEERFSLVFLAARPGAPEIELTYNWDQQEPYPSGRNFGHLAFRVSQLYQICDKLQNSGHKIIRPPRDGKMAIVKSPDQISIKLLQQGDPLPLTEPWVSQENLGEW